MLRAHLDNVNDGDNGSVTLLRMLVTPTNGAIGDEPTFNLLKQELKRSKWLTPATMKLVYETQPWLGVRRGEIITALCTIMHPIMSKINALAFSKGNILETVTKDRYINHAAAVADLFLERFDPKNPLSDQELEQRSEDLKAMIDNEVEDTPAQALFFKMIGALYADWFQLIVGVTLLLTFTLLFCRHCEAHAQDQYLHEQPILSGASFGSKNHGIRRRGAPRDALWYHLCARKAF